MKGQKGITLIALVITIIVLLILAGVSIAMLTGEHGILTEADRSTVTDIEARVNEEVRLAIQATKLAIENQTAQDNSWSAASNSDKNGLTGGIKKTTTGENFEQTSTITDESEAGVTLYSLLHDLGTGYSFTSTVTTNSDPTLSTAVVKIKYTGSDYTKARNEATASITYIVNISQHEAKLQSEKPAIAP